MTYTLPSAGRVRLEVYACTGQRVAVLAEGTRNAGAHVAQWDGRSPQGDRLPTGVYFLRFAFEGREEARKIVRLE